MADVEVLTEEWVQSLAGASESLAEGQYSAVVAVSIGKTKKAVLDIVSGRVTGPGPEDAVTVTVPTSADQLASFSDGSESAAEAYMKGDLKPVGSTGALLAFIELFENADFRKNLTSSQ